MDFLYNTDIVVAIAFVIFIGILLYVGVPGMVTKLLDERAEKIKADIAEARELREEAQQLLASYERKQKEVEELSAEIVSKAREDAQAAAAQAKVELEQSIARRLDSAKDQIASAESAAMKEVKDRAVAVAVAAARDVITDKMDASRANALIDDAIGEVGQKLH
ncbi:F0F1 ATP synthase subunit B family protein [Pontivivens insulae]|uniref:ATP synthase subunit b n=1 Tax=Pontivivens insulae TaxID=1639689 RepID=A0A2R8AF30_9RHOB|nr:ATP F0F1 synthase subunit B [Pontivivens insulae]RED12041.1 F-type H+-transporting ATPase subunit b [Pontivivens insulae]SPF30797.1 ATP synthase subunit b [Pontivivens insulae]